MKVPTTILLFNTCTSYTLHRSRIIIVSWDSGSVIIHLHLLSRIHYPNELTIIILHVFDSIISNVTHYLDPDIRCDSLEFYYEKISIDGSNTDKT